MIHDILENYLYHYPSEKDNLSLAIKQSEGVSISNEQTLYDRKNFIGHFTASIFLICPSEKKILLLEHKSLKKLLQPGGHIEASDKDPLSAALRELFEETKINQEKLYYRPLDSINQLVPFHISSHYIPENPKKNELAHYHHDLEYLFTIDMTENVCIDQNESNNFQWVSLEIFAKQDHFKLALPKIREIMSKRSASFFLNSFIQKYITQNGINKEHIKKIRCIAIQHILPSTYDFILSLDNLFEKLVIFAKPKSIDFPTKKRLEKKGIEIRMAKRTDNIVDYYLGNDKKTKTVLLDIGGYFSPIYKERPNNVIGVVEDTENGLQKYEEHLKNYSYPIASVARSCLKDNEDMLVGKSIINATDTILRNKNIVLSYCRCSIIGYGKIGSSIARGLLEVNIKPSIVEKNPIRALKAVNEYCYIQPLSKVLEDSKIIFCATGQKSLSVADFRCIRNGAYIISVTSSDDEFDMQYLDEEYSKKDEDQYITKYYNQNNYFYLVNNGHAPNFIYNAAIGTFIYPVLAECLCLLLQLIFYSHKNQNHNCIMYSSEDNKRLIASEWLNEFTLPRIII